jgi:CheY-like chemotaxis protein
LLPAAIDLRVEIDERVRTLRIKGDSTQMQQVILNLALNARDAMPRGGELRVTAELHDAALAGHGQGTAENTTAGVRISVCDTGTGMSPDVLDRIYEPFYSTKPRGQGTGLGLAIVVGIVQSHHGRIEVQSEVGRGTCMHVWLPLARPDEPEPLASPHKTGFGGRRPRIVLADKHPYIRQIMATTLEAEDYRVIPVSDGEALMRYYGANVDKIDLIVVSMDLPKRTGLACLADIRNDGFGRPVILINGAGDMDAEEQLDQQTLLLRKPFQMADLTCLVGNLLRRAGQEEAE